MCDVQMGVSACLVIPSVRGFSLTDWEATERAMGAAARLDFGQSWFPEPEADFKPGYVGLGVQDDALVVHAVLCDDEPANRATRWNESTWKKGDVLEFFFQADGRAGYHEFHVTPENQRLQLFFPDREAFRRGHNLWTIAESRFESATRVDAARTRWEVMMRINLAWVLDEPRDDASRRFRYSFSRYDYQPGRERPVLSATTRLSAPHFHTIAEWAWAEAARE